MPKVKFVPLSDKKTIKRLYKLGHFHNPASPTPSVTKEVRDTLAFRDRETAYAVQSFQNFMADDFNRLSQEQHGRDGIADGLIGPATQRLLQVERCGCPDYAMATEEAGRTSWPKGCHEEYPDHHAFAVKFDKSKMPDFLRMNFERAWALCRAAYADVGIWFFETSSTAKAQTLVTWQRGSGWIGLAVVPNSPRCGERIWAKFDTRYRPTALVDQWARLLSHEFCHNMGLSHTRGGIMNPGIVGGKFDKDEWRGDPSFPALKKLFGGEPINLDGDVPGPPPEPPTDGEGEPLSGTIAIGQHMYQLSGTGVRT